MVDAQKAAPKKAGWFLYVVLALILFMVYSCVRPKSVEEDGASSVLDAKSACLTAINKLLKDPGSEKMDQIAAWPYSMTGPSILNMTVQIRSKNSFGAYVPATFGCEAHQFQGAWSAYKVVPLTN